MVTVLALRHPCSAIVSAPDRPKRRDSPGALSYDLVPMNKLLVCAGGVVAMSLLANAGCSSTSGGDGVGAEGGYGAGTGSGGSSASGGGLGLGGNGASIAVGGMAGSGAVGGGGLVCDPGAYDIPGNNFDDDCDGQIDNEVVGCDGAIPDIGYADPMSAAQAIGLCKVAQGGSWGVIEAKYVKADGTAGMNPTSHGLLPNFGPNVQTQEGQRLLALSSGAARRPGDIGYLTPQDGSMGTQSPQPPGFPIDTPACPGVTTGGNAIDPAGLELRVRVPSNAKSFKFAFNFYTAEYPVYICTAFNDFFVALQNPAPPNAVQGNISFDSQNNPVSVNNSMLDVCVPGTHKGKTFPCPLGTGQLQGTGFQGGAATGWLETQSPVDPGSEITLRFTIYDVGDDWLDSTVLIDNFQWSVEESTGSVTKPVPR